MALDPSITLSVEQANGVPIAISLASLGANAEQDGNAVSLVEPMATRRITIGDLKAGAFDAAAAVPRAMASMDDSTLLAAADVQAALNPDPGYTAPAVHFDGSSWLDCPAITASNSAFLLVSGWVKFDSFDDGNSIFDFDPGNLEISCEVYPDHVTISSSPDGNANLQWTATTAVFADLAWHNVLLATDTMGKVAQLYIDDTAVDLVLSSDLPPFIQPFDGLEVAVPENDTFGFLHPLTGDMADVRIAPGMSLDLSVTANRRYFIDASGKPVNPTAATAALGEPPMLFSGDASTFGTNQGTGGAFALTGAITDASSSPSS